MDGRSPFAQLLHAVCAVPGLRARSLHLAAPDRLQGRPRRLLRASCPIFASTSTCRCNRAATAFSRRCIAPTRATSTCGLIEKLRAAQPKIAFTTDIIVGFPGETEDDFRQTCDLVREVGFDNAFIFRYSPRRDTPAATMEGQLPEEVKMERNQVLLRILDEIADAPREETARHARTKFSSRAKAAPTTARFQGRTRTNRLVLIEANERWRGELLPVRLTESTGFTYYAEPVLQPETV